MTGNNGSTWNNDGNCNNHDKLDNYNHCANYLNYHKYHHWNDYTPCDCYHIPLIHSTCNIRVRRDMRCISTTYTYDNQFNYNDNYLGEALAQFNDSANQACGSHNHDIVDWGNGVWST